MPAMSGNQGPKRKGEVIGEAEEESQQVCLERENRNQRAAFVGLRAAGYGLRKSGSDSF